MEKYLKYVLALVAVGFIAYMLFAAFAKEVGATEKKVDICHKGETINISVSAANKHLEEHEEDYKGKCKKATYQWVETGTKWSEVCKAETPACGTVSEGTEYGTLTEKCQKVEASEEVSDRVRVKPECKKGDTRTTEVSRGCAIEGDSCPVIPPVVPPVKKDTPDRVKFSYTQGSDKGKGDGMCKLQWKQIEGSKKVEIRYAEDSVFGNGYKTVKVKDDGSHWVNVEKGSFKIRGRDSKTDWSETKGLSC